MRRLLAGLVFIGVLLRAAAADAPVRTLANAHSHNDYEHPRPLLDALDQGFCGVEADVFPISGDLLVAHDRRNLNPGRTLRSLYLDPLAEMVRKKTGIFSVPGTRLTLLVDVKQDGVMGYQLLKEQLLSYGPMITRFQDSGVVTGAVTVIISGDRAFALAKADKDRPFALDGRIQDLTNGVPATLVPWVSDNWQGLFKWRGEGDVPAADSAKLRTYVDQAHSQGRALRFWAAPDNPEAWRLFRDAGVDIINTDKLADLAAFLRGEPVPRREIPDGQ